VLRSIRRAVESLRTTEPGMARPVTDARLGAEGHQLVARQDGARFDPVTGQRLLDFELSSLREDVVRALRPQPSKRQRDAYAQYLEGLRLDEEETTRDRAEQAYRKAIDLDPRLATALTNPGTLRLVAGDHRRGPVARAAPTGCRCSARRLGAEGARRRIRVDERAVMRITVYTCGRERFGQGPECPSDSTCTQIRGGPRFRLRLGQRRGYRRRSRGDPVRPAENPDHSIELTGRPVSPPRRRSNRRVRPERRGTH